MSSDRDGAHDYAVVHTTKGLGTSLSGHGQRGLPSLNQNGPGSFSTELRSHTAGTKRSLRPAEMEMVPDKHGYGFSAIPEKSLVALKESLNRELKIKEGSENMLEALQSKKAKQTKEQRAKVEAELSSAIERIKNLTSQIADIQSAKPQAPSTPTRARLAGLFSSTGRQSPVAPIESPNGSDNEESTESPTYALAEILRALEAEGLAPDYYVHHANNLVALFKRYPSLKYDLVWAVFGLRIQVMLLSDSREVVAAGYRIARHAMSDLNSLQRLRSLNTDYLVILSLIKERKADVEREQALKFVRAFLDVKDGARAVSRAVVRTIAAVAEHGEDRLRPMCIETLGELMVRDPALLVAAGGIGPLTDALGEGIYDASEGLVAAFLYLLDLPERRAYLRSGRELDVLFTAFTDSLYGRERTLKQNAKAIVLAMRSWPGMFTLSMWDFRAIRSLIASLIIPSPMVRETIVDLIFVLLRIKSPSWSTSFLAGRRLTTYGRVANLKATGSKTNNISVFDEDSAERHLIDHYTALTLAVLISAGMLPALIGITRDHENPSLKRKTTLLIGEILKLANKLLPSSWSADLQLLPELFAAASRFGSDERYIATGTVYQIDSVNRTLYRSTPSTTNVVPSFVASASDENLLRFDDPAKPVTAHALDEPSFRQMMLDTNVLSSTNYNKWNWEMILRIIEGPLLNGKRLDEAIKASKFIKRLVSFYRPFKYRFSASRNNRLNQKYIRVGCALIHTLLQTSEGIKYLAENKLLRQIAECLAQCDPASGLTAQAPMFHPGRLTETLCHGYFAMLGVLSSDPKGLQMLDRWRMINMIYHIFDLKQRPDLVRLLLSNFEYTLHGHPRVLLSKALTAGTKEIRIYATNILRKYVCKSRIKSPDGEGVSDSKWAIQLLVTQLYDPDLEVCAIAIKILEEACNRADYLEYIVECRPALDHLGEIGAPLLLRFLSSSIGYHYLDGLDYISNEMDDWFLGRNDAYVGVIEAVLARAFMESHEGPPEGIGVDEDMYEPERFDDVARVPPHFYKELARTKEGCKLLRDKGHFEEFAATIRECGMQNKDPETVLKVKGCLWAVGNVGSMDLGAAFIEESDVVRNIVEIAENHKIMSLRGTAFFVLGLISRSVTGLEILSEYGWDSNTTTMGISLGMCIPRELGKFFSYKAWPHQKASDIHLGGGQVTTNAGLTGGATASDEQILRLVVDLGNTVLTKRAIGELMRIKQDRAPGFRQPQLFQRVMTILECHHYRLPIRRFVIDLFDRSVMRRMVLEEDDDDDSDADVSSDTGSMGTGTERQRSISAPSAPLRLQRLEGS
jgi:hypothetical protein